VSIVVERFAGRAEEWDAGVRDTAGWTHFHLYGWRRVMEAAMGHECVYLVARGEAGQVVGVLPLVRVKSRLFGHYLVSMPFLNYGGPLGSGEAVRALVAAATRQAEADQVRLLELRNAAALPLDLSVSHRKITVLLDIDPGGPEPLWKALPAKVRSQVRRPQKEGVEVRFGPDQLDAFYSVFAHHMRDLGTPVLGKGFFKRIADSFPADSWIGCAWLGDRAIAAGWGFRWQDEFEMTWASALRDYNSIAPNMALYWGFMERGAQLGVRRFNFGRCTPGSGTHRFKQQWGGRDEPLWWYQYPAGEDAATPSPHDPRYAWGPRLWRRLPLAVATALGPRIVRLVP